MHQRRRVLYNAEIVLVFKFGGWCSGWCIGWCIEQCKAGRPRYGDSGGTRGGRYREVTRGCNLPPTNGSVQCFVLLRPTAAAVVAVVAAVVAVADPLTDVFLDNAEMNGVRFRPPVHQGKRLTVSLAHVAAAQPNVGGPLLHDQPFQTNAVESAVPSGGSRVRGECDSIRGCLFARRRVNQLVQHFFSFVNGLFLFCSIFILFILFILLSNPSPFLNSP